MRRTLLAMMIALALVAGACSSDDETDEGAPPSGEQPEGDGTEPRFAEGRCPFDVPREAREAVRCGTVAVPLNHQEPDGDTIDLAVAVVEAQPQEGQQAAEDPVIALGGGPGQKLLKIFDQFVGRLEPVLAQRDVVLVDQRGVGASRPALNCPAVDELGLQPDVTPEEQVAASEGCYQRLTGEDKELSAYDTLANAEDLDVVRQALGYEQVNVFGTSYGARLALQYSRDHAESIRSMVLNSPIPAEENFIADATGNTQATLDRLFAACAADAACNGAYPNLSATLDQVVAQVEMAPPTVEIVIPATGDTVPVEVTPDVLAGSIFQYFYISPLIGALPDAITIAATGDLTPLVQGAALGISPGGQSQGMYNSLICAEEIAYADQDQVAAEQRALSPLLQASTTFDITTQVCESWTVDRADEQTFEPISNDTRTLVVTGEYDHVTPTSYGEAIVEEMPRSTLLDVPGAGHDPLSPAAFPDDQSCGGTILAAFFADPDAEPDTSCATGGGLRIAPIGPILEQVLQGGMMGGGGN